MLVAKGGHHAKLTAIGVIRRARVGVVSAQVFIISLSQQMALSKTDIHWRRHQKPLFRVSTGNRPLRTGARLTIGIAQGARSHHLRACSSDGSMMLSFGRCGMSFGMGFGMSFGMGFCMSGDSFTLFSPLVVGGTATALKDSATKRHHEEPAIGGSGSSEGPAIGGGSSSRSGSDLGAGPLSLPPAGPAHGKVQQRRQQLPSQPLAAAARARASLCQLRPCRQSL